MREVTIYYAYDDTEFDSKEECLAYESKVLAELREIAEAYSFFDEDTKIIPSPMWGLDNIEVWMKWFERAAENCEWIHRFKNLSKKAEEFLYYTEGFFLRNCDFNNELGFFKYDYNKGEWVIKWAKPTLIFWTIWMSYIQIKKERVMRSVLSWNKIVSFNVCGSYNSHNV